MTSPDRDSDLGRPALRRDKAFDRPGDDQHRSDADDQRAGPPRVGNDRIATTQPPGIEHAGRDQQTRPAGDLNRREFDHAVRGDCGPIVVAESGVLE